MAPTDSPTHRLVTLPLSHFVLKARWALERYGIEYVEEGHAPGFHAPAVISLTNSTSTTPVLVRAHST